MRNPALHDALRDFALEAAALLTEEQRAGAELEFDLTQERRRRGPALYCYRPLTEKFIAERWARLRALPSCGPAAEALRSGAAQYLRVAGLRGEQAEPALQAMLERLYEDATSFPFPEERFERVYREVEATLYRDTLRATVVAPLPGMWLEPVRVDLGDGLALARGEALDAPEEAVWPEGGAEPNVLCVLEQDVEQDEPLPAAEASERFRRLVTSLRLYKAGGVTLGSIGWRRAAEGRWQPIELEGAGTARGGTWTLREEEAAELREFLAAVDGSAHDGVVRWALSRFDMGLSRPKPSESLSDYLLALQGLIDATSDAGRASLSLRLAALCAEERDRRAVRRRVELAFSLERLVMRGASEEAYSDGPESLPQIVSEMEGHLRALLRDVLCGYLDPDMKTVADDILLQSPEPLEVEARDLRGDSEATAAPAEAAAGGSDADADTEELEAVGPLRPSGATDRRGPASRPEPDGVTPATDWESSRVPSLPGPLDEAPESYSAPV